MAMNYIAPSAAPSLSSAATVSQSLKLIRSSSLNRRGNQDGHRCRLTRASEPRRHKGANKNQFAGCKITVEGMVELAVDLISMVNMLPRFHITSMIATHKQQHGTGTAARLSCFPVHTTIRIAAMSYRVHSVTMLPWHSQA